LPNETPKGRSYIKINGQGVFHLGDHIIYTDHGPEVWLPYLEDRQLAEMFILWQPDAPDLQYVQTVVDSGPYQRTKRWITQANWESMWRIEMQDRPAYFWEASLDDVCVKPNRNEPFPWSEQELKTFQY
jgi:hypothetical protein